MFESTWYEIRWRKYQEEAADPVAEEETRDLTDSIAAAAARKPGDGRSMMRVKTGPQMVRRKVPRWVGKLRSFFLKIRK